MHLADGNIDVKYGRLPEGQDASVDTTVELMADMAKGQYGARSPKVRALAINILNAARVPNKDYFGMVEAIHNYVRDNIRYIKDPVGQETLSYPEETLLNSKAGDCDDMTIAEMGLLGSIGLRSYPVVIGLVPGLYSHVYLHAEIPPGKHRYAGTTIAADPIMREWSLGKAAPADKVKAKKVYPHLAGLGNMSINGYATGPSYFSPQDELEASQVPAVLKSRYVDTGSRGEVVNAKRLTQWGDELDDMFDRSATVSPMQAAPAYDLYSRGPVTNRAEKVLTSYLHEGTPVRRISAPMQRGPKIVHIQDRKVQKKVRVAPSVGELMGLSDYLSDLALEGEGASGRHLVAGKGDPLHRAIAATKLAKQRAFKASDRVVRMRNGDGFMPGLGSLDRARITGNAERIEELAYQIVAKASAIAKMCAGGSPVRQAALQTGFGLIEHMDANLGVVEAVTENVDYNDDPYQDAEDKVNTLATIMQDSAFREASVAKATPKAPKSATNPVKGAPVGAIVRDADGRVMFADDGLADLGRWGGFRRITQAAQQIVAAPKRAVQQVQQQVKKTQQNVKAQLSKASRDVKALAKNKKLRKFALGVATAGGSLLTEKTVHAAAQRLMRKKGGGDQSVVTPTSTSVPDEQAYGDQAVVPQPGENTYMPDQDPNAAPVDQSFGPEDMSAPQEFETAAQDQAAGGGGGGGMPGEIGPGGESGTMVDVDENSADPFASAAADAGGGDETYAEQAQETAAPAQRQQTARPAVPRAPEDLDNADVYPDDDNTEDGGQGEEPSSAEEPSVEGLPSVGGIGLGTLALAGLATYFILRKK